jgi:hypothetical protein
MVRRINRALVVPNHPRDLFLYVSGTTDFGELALMLTTTTPISLGVIRRRGPSSSANNNFYTRGTFLWGPTALKNMVAHAGAGPEPVPRNMLYSQSLVNDVRLLFAPYSKSSCGSKAQLMANGEGGSYQDGGPVS